MARSRCDTPLVIITHPFFFFFATKFRQNEKKKLLKGIFCLNILFFWKKAQNFGEKFRHIWTVLLVWSFGSRFFFFKIKNLLFKNQSPFNAKSLLGY
jgi:hypothetical protein